MKYIGDIYYVDSHVKQRWNSFIIRLKKANYNEVIPQLYWSYIVVAVVIVVFVVFCYFVVFVVVNVANVVVVVLVVVVVNTVLSSYTPWGYCCCCLCCFCYCCSLWSCCCCCLCRNYFLLSLLIRLFLAVNLGTPWGYNWVSVGISVWGGRW